eukprot:2025046-Amphidinium_carterae.1
MQSIRKMWFAAWRFKPSPPAFSEISITLKLGGMIGSTPSSPSQIPDTMCKTTANSQIRHIRRLQGWICLKGNDHVVLGHDRHTAHQLRTAHSFRL